MSKLVEQLHEYKNSINTVAVEPSGVIELLGLDENNARIAAAFISNNRHKFNSILIKLIDKKIALYENSDLNNIIDSEIERLTTANKTPSLQSQNTISAYRNKALTVIAGIFIISSAVALTGILGAPILAIGIITASAALFTALTGLLSYLNKLSAHAKHNKILEDIKTEKSVFENLQTNQAFIDAKNNHSQDYNAAAKSILEGAHPENDSEPDVRLDGPNDDESLEESLERATTIALRNLNNNDEGITSSSSSSPSVVSFVSNRIVSFFNGANDPNNNLSPLEEYSSDNIPDSARL